MPSSLGNSLPLAAHIAMPDQNVQEELKGYGRTKSSMLVLTRAESITRSPTYSLPRRWGFPNGNTPIPITTHGCWGPAPFYFLPFQFRVPPHFWPTWSHLHRSATWSLVLPPAAAQPHTQVVVDLLDSGDQPPSHCVQFTTNTCTGLAGHSESLSKGPSVTL